MASFTFNVNGQNFELIEDEAHVSDSVRYLDASFSFDERWDGLRKFLIFEKGSESYKVEIVDNRIRPEANIILADGPWKVSVIGEKVVGDDLVKRITTDPQRIIMKKSGIKNGDPFPEITPTIGEQIVERAASEADRAEEAAGQAAESAGVAESAANNASLFSENAKSQAERAESAENASKRYAEDAKDEAETASFFADTAFNNAQEAKRQADRSEASMFEAQYQAEEAKRAADEAKHNTYDDTEVRELIAGNTEEIEKVNETTSELSDGLANKADKSELTDFVKNTDYATKQKAGIMKAGNGLYARGNGEIILDYAIQSNVDNRTPQSIIGNNLLPMTIGILDYAVKAAMTDGKGASWTEAEQLSARQRLGIDKEWVLKGTLTTENISSAIGLNVDMAECTEMVVVGSYTSTGSANLTCNVHTIGDSFFVNGSRTIFMHFKDTKWGIEPVADKFRGVKDATYVYGNGTAAAWISGKHISDINIIRSSTTANIFTECNIVIWAR